MSKQDFLKTKVMSQTFGEGNSCTIILENGVSQTGYPQVNEIYVSDDEAKEAARKSAMGKLCMFSGYNENDAKQLGIEW